MKCQYELEQKRSAKKIPMGDMRFQISEEVDSDPSLLRCMGTDDAPKKSNAEEKTQNAGTAAHVRGKHQLRYRCFCPKSILSAV